MLAHVAAGHAPGGSQSAEDTSFTRPAGRSSSASDRRRKPRLRRSPATPDQTRPQAGRQLGVLRRHTLSCHTTATTHDWWEPLTPTQADEEHKFNRSEYLRVLSPTNPDYDRVYGMRADTESLNAQFERAFYNRRLPAWGLHNQTPVASPRPASARAHRAERVIGTARTGPQRRPPSDHAPRPTRLLVPCCADGHPGADSHALTTTPPVLELPLSVGWAQRRRVSRIPGIALCECRRPRVPVFALRERAGAVAALPRRLSASTFMRGSRLAMAALKNVELLRARSHQSLARSLTYPGVGVDGKSKARVVPRVRSPRLVPGAPAGIRALETRLDPARSGQGHTGFPQGIPHVPPS